MAEWSMNLSPVLRFEGQGQAWTPTESPRDQRRVVGYTLDPFPGGFVSVGRIEEGRSLSIAEGWRQDGPVADSWIAVAALPDDATVIGLHLSRARGMRPPLLSAHGLNLLIPDDVHNSRRRMLERVSPCHIAVDGVLDVLSDQELGVTPVPSTDETGLRSIGVEQIRSGTRRGTYWASAHETIVNSAWLVRVRDPEDPTPLLEHSTNAEGVHTVTATVPSGRWNLIFSPDSMSAATWGESPGTANVISSESSFPGLPR